MEGRGVWLGAFDSVSEKVEKLGAFEGENVGDLSTSGKLKVLDEDIIP